MLLHRGRGLPLLSLFLPKRIVMGFHTIIMACFLDVRDVNFTVVDEP